VESGKVLHGGLLSGPQSVLELPSPSFPFRPNDIGYFHDANALRESEYNRGTGCGKTARPGLCGACRVTGIPTAETSKTIKMIKKIWCTVKLIYIHLVYVFVGLDQEYFYMVRANYFTDLGLFSYAIGNYKKILNESTEPRVKAALGYCYIMVGDYDKSVHFYREAYLKSKHPDIVLGLACAILNKGDIEEGRKVLETLSQNEKDLEPYHLNELNRLNQEIEAINIENKV
jgi:hypothetical protein